MNQTAFDLLADGMRYVFAILISLIVIRLVLVLLRENRKDRFTRKQEKGVQMGYVEIVEPENNQKLFGQRFALRQENQIGSSSECEIRIRYSGVRPIHAGIFQKSNRIILRDYLSKNGVYLNGQRITQDTALLDGDEISLGIVTLLLHLTGRQQSPQTIQKIEQERLQAIQTAQGVWESLEEQNFDEYSDQTDQFDDYYEESDYQEEEEENEYSDNPEWDQEEGEWDDEDHPYR